MELKGALPYAGMVGVQFARVGLMIFGKEAMSTGMTNFTFVSHSNALAALILLPFAFLVNRSSRPPLSFSLLCGLFLLGLLGCAAQLSGYAGIQCTSASFASAMQNLTPGFTFILAVIFRMEKLDCKSPSTLAKLIGTVVSILGAFMVTLYKGHQILMNPSYAPQRHLLMHRSQWVIGGLFLAVECVLASAFLIVQALILRSYPAELVIVFFYCFFVAILSSVVSLIVERDVSAWMLQPRMRLVAVLYSGLFGYALQFSIRAWCLHKRGPVFVAMFHPLGIVIAAVLGIIFLGDTFYLGSLIGSVVIVIGFYSVMWGRAKDVKVVDGAAKRLESTSEKAPFLEINVDETVSQ